MADDLIGIKKSSYGRYEELLIRRDNLKKEAFLADREYMRVFGELILDVFNRKIDCIRLKKSIEFCQRYVNRGESIDSDALQEYLEGEMADYENQLEELIKNNENARNGKSISEADLLKIKRIYHRLVKKIHPDINPMTNEDEDLRGLWERLMAAYNCNDLKEMEETEALINIFLGRLDCGCADFEIPNIDEKIEELEAEIETIMNTDPYMYKYLLENEKLVAEKRADLERELKEYEEYQAKLQGILDELTEKGVKFVWRMN